MNAGDRVEVIGGEHKGQRGEITFTGMQQDVFPLYYVKLDIEKDERRVRQYRPHSIKGVLMDVAAQVERKAS